MLVYGHTLQPVRPLAIAERGAESTSALMGHRHSCTLTAVFQAWWRSQGGGASVQGQLGPWTHGTAPGRAQAGDPWRHDRVSQCCCLCGALPGIPGMGWRGSHGS